MFWLYYCESVSALPDEVSESIKRLFEGLNYIGPAYNILTRFLIMLPADVLRLYQIYPNIIEKKDEMMRLLGLEFTRDGKVDVKSYEFGEYLRGSFLSVFRLLSDCESRASILRMMGVSEEEFKEYDPLRAWLEVSMDYTKEVMPSALKLLNIIVETLLDKDSIYLESDEWRKKVEGFENVDICLRFLYENVLLLPPFTSGHIRRNECPLTLNIYSDLRDKLKG